jgi:hypothetical protein
MSEEQHIQQVVAEVLKRLLPHMGASGERGSVTVVFTGATAGFTEALQQIRTLVLAGFRAELVFSRGAEELYAKHVWDQLEGFPHIAPLENSKWLRAVKETRAIVVPMLSVNTLSKLSLLIGDNMTSNVVLHGLFMGKPVILARNGVDPSDAGRIEPHFPGASAGLATAIEERLQVARSYGCTVTDVGRLCGALQAALNPATAASAHDGRAERTAASAPQCTNNIVTAADVLQAHHSGTQLRVRRSTVITPLARELAGKHGVCLLQDSSR